MVYNAIAIVQPLQRAHSKHLDVATAAREEKSKTRVINNAKTFASLVNLVAESDREIDLQTD